MDFSKLFRQLAAIFRPPFEDLGIVVWIYFVWCFIAHPHSPILRGDFPDSDDYMILNHTLDWLKGQSWFDVTQYRLNPPDGTFLHFSRLIELPLAGLILSFRALGLGWLGAATITAALWPLALLAGLLAALRWQARLFMSSRWANATAFVALFALPAMLSFTPGRVDHHGFVLLTTLLAFICAVQMIREPENVKWAAGSGLFLALGQAVALETLPWLLLLSSWNGLRMMAVGRPAARGGLVFGLSLYVGSAVFLALTRHPSNWFSPDLLSYSIVYVLLANSIAICLTGVALASQHRLSLLRYVIGIGLGAVTALSFFELFPSLLAGPYGAVDKTLAKMFFDHIVEMQPAAGSPVNLPSALLPLMGGVVCFVLLPKTEDKGRWPQWFLLFLFVLAGLLLSAFYQVRMASYAVLFSVVPLTEFLRRSLAWVSANTRGRRLAAAELGLVLLVGPLPAVLLPAVLDGRPFNTGILMFPVQRPKTDCPMSGLETVLNDPDGLGDRPRTIMNTINEGAELLFRTRHKVVAAPYHTNAAGVMDAVNFFSATEPAEAYKIVRGRNADLVVLCKPLSCVYRAKAKQAGEDNAPPSGETLAEALVRGQTPAWLTPVKLPDTSPFLLFEVTPGD